MFKLLKKHGAVCASTIAVLGIIAFFSACNMPMGLGKPIDWEPPVLSLEKNPDTGKTIYPNPMYVKKGAKLSGTVTDNVGVDRVILREAGSTKEMFRATLTGNRWEIELEFTDADNGKKMAAEIVAYDRAGNSGDNSIAAITLIIDLRPPVTDDAWIQRTVLRTAILEPTYESYNELKELEILDPSGFGDKELGDTADRYQNGWFRIQARVSEEETRILKIEARIYDAEKDPNEPLVILDSEEGTSVFSPRWLVKEDKILAAGEAKWPGYTADYNSGKRYYYRVDIVAYDRGGNSTDAEGAAAPGEGELVPLAPETRGFFCMWTKGDEPKGLLDPRLGTIIVKGTPLPVMFFDDDSLDWAYTDLFTKDQWEDSTIVKEKTSGNPDETTDEKKLNWLLEDLSKGAASTIRNWDNQPITEVLKLDATKTMDEQWKYVPTGNKEDDYGEYVLFTLVKDKKIAPHLVQGDPGYTETTTPSQWRGRVQYISIIDDSLPVIVFDTVVKTSQGWPESSGGKETDPHLQTGDSPEENTFPKLTEKNPGDGGRMFEINGYTLRENSAGYLPDGSPNPDIVHNGVRYFSMAWIPARIDGGPDAYIRQVQDALAGREDKDGNPIEFPQHVKHWRFQAPENPGDTFTPPTGVTELVDGTPESIGENASGAIKYRKQVFRKSFNILEDFIYEGDGELENEIKVFVFCAIDKQPGKEPVFRTLRLLGNKTLPEIKVFDFTREPGFTVAPPNLSDYDDIANGGDGSGTIEDDERAAYEADLAAYQETAYNNVFAGNGATFETNESEPYTTYTRDTTLKFWVTAEGGGDLAISKITMQDITYTSENKPETGYYDSSANVLTYTETLPEVTSRVFLFTATDMLENKAQVQRTIAIASTAVLTDITTTTPSGEYGIGTTITLRANFSGQVQWTGTDRPKLNVRYNLNGTDTVQQIETKTPADTPVLALEFDVTVAEGDTGTLLTADAGFGGTGDQNQPLVVAGVRNILDAVRGDPAFIPEYNMPNWTTNSANTLQGGALTGSPPAYPKKNITLDGIRPTVSTLEIDSSSKTPYATGEYYLKVGETVYFVLGGASETIMPQGTPKLRLTIGAFSTTASYQRPSGSDMVFSYTVPATTTAYADAEITGIYVMEERNGTTGVLEHGIIDKVGNSVTAIPIAFTGTSASSVVRIDRTAPPVPTGIQLNGAAIVNNATFNVNPNLTVSTTTTGEPWGLDKTEYSTNNGITWADYTAGVPVLDNGEHIIKTRHTDKAGNIGAESSHTIEINVDFPKLVTITAAQPNGYYTNRTGANSTLNFTLGFENAVTISNGATVSIQLTNRNATPGTYGTSPVLTNPTLASSTSITFAWSLNGDYEMPDGLYVSAIVLTGLTDRFGNGGPAGVTINTADPYAITGTSFGAYTPTVANLNGEGLKVDTVAPAVTAVSPANADGSTATTNITTMVSTDNKTIRLTFRENMQKGTGTITIKPRGATENTYAIPAVLENDGYYLDADGVTRYTSPQDNTTFVPGLSNIYNSLTSATDKNALITGGTLSSPTLHDLTGNGVGPYIKLTNGLREGNGYTGNYNNTNPGVNAPGPVAAPAGDAYMVPDTTTKWVLDYQYTITQNTAALNAIRTALNNAEYRWQKIAVTSGDVKIGTVSGGTFTEGAGNVVQITLPEPLLKGLQWVMDYPAAAFTDVAGNAATGFPTTGVTNNYWFWSNGAQTPTIRVNRKSYDARASAPIYTAAGGTNPFPGSTTVALRRQSWPYVANGYNGAITDFNTINYRIETETPGARIYYGTRLGANMMHPTSTTIPIGSVTASFTAAIAYAGTAANTGVTNATPAGLTLANMTWGSAKDAANSRTTGAWITPNLIYRSVNDNAMRNYTVDDNGININMRIASNFKGIRSFNKDALKSELTNRTTTPLTGVTATVYAGEFTYDSYQASKNYVVAEARVVYDGTTNFGTAPADNISALSYEGVFRSVLMLNQNWRAVTAANETPILIMGSNVKNGLPNVAGFPVRDAVEERDTRFIKLFYRDPTLNGGSQAGSCYYWVSSEIVTQWYMIKFGTGIDTDRHMNGGDANNYLYSGYGDVSYALDLD